MLDIKSSSRVKFPKGKQKKFLEQVLSVLDIELSELAKILNICPRTLRDWKREKYNMSYGSLKSICKRAKTDLPKDTKVLPEYWSVKKASKLGALRRIELYGNPGTPEGRRKGGLNTQKKFRSDPRIAKRIGFILRKKIKYPKESPALAEFIGIMLGDGGLPGNHQITISFNNKTDYEYAMYICKIIKQLFCVNYHIHKRRESNGADIVVNSSNLVDFLLTQGLKPGNKVKNQIRVPRWICRKPEYKIACLRGLMDTDGGLYFHKYDSNGKTYTYLKLGFTNRSKPLLKFVFKVLNKLKHKAFLNGDNLSIGSQFEVKRYFRETGSRNPKHLNRFRTYFDN